MSIDTSGKWWRGSDPTDIRGYLEAYAEDGYQVNEFRLARCGCGSLDFHLEADDDEGVARRTCVACGGARFVCDSDEYWAEAKPELWKCIECASTAANVGVGFSLYPDGGIRWLYVGERCSTCGVLGCFVGWKVGLDDMSLLERA